MFYPTKKWIHNYLNVFIFLILVLNSCASATANVTPLSQDESNKKITPDRLYNRVLSYFHRGFIPFTELIDQLLENEVIFLGEIHNSKTGHQYQLRILNSFYHKEKRLIIVMEMFDRDIQPVLNQYLKGEISEKKFLAHSRPWPNYKTDYRPLVEFAKKHQIPVIGMNAPSPILRKVVKEGRQAIDTLKPSERKHIAEFIDFEHRAYRKYFFENLPKNHPGIEKISKKLYEASAVKDSTMADTITKILQNPQYNGYKVISINGSFHSNKGLAIPIRVKARKPDVKLETVFITPLKKKEKIKLDNYVSTEKIADYIIFTDYKESYKIEIPKKKKKNASKT